MANEQAPIVSGSLYSRMMAPSSLPQVYTTTVPPFFITFVNSAWERLCGFTAESAVGRTCAILQGARTCKHTLGQIAEAVAAGLPIKVVLINYTRMGVPFTNYLTLEPLCLGPTTSPGPTHYVGTLCASPCHEAVGLATRLSMRESMGMSMGVHAPAKANDACGAQPLACRQIVEEMLAESGNAPVSLPQLLCAMAYVLPVEMATALVELVRALLREEVQVSTVEFEGALRILLGGHVEILSELVGWLALLAPEVTGDVLGDAASARTTLDAYTACEPSTSADASSMSIDDIMAPDLDLLLANLDLVSPGFQNS